jgi:hypothetical protein
MKKTILFFIFRKFSRIGLFLLIWTLMTPLLLAQRTVNFPPAESKPPPPAKAPPKTQSSGEETDIIGDNGPAMRKTQERSPPPPTTLTVMYKLQYGEKLKYVHPDGVVQVFEQWQSFPNDAYNLVINTNQRLADGNNYQYATKPLQSPGFDPVDIPILYMTGDYAFELTDTEVLNLRKFLTDGGTIIFNAARGLDEYSYSVVKQMRRVFPQKTFMRVPLDHPIFNAKYRIQQALTLVNGVQFTQPPEVYSIDVGTRATAILVPMGLGTAWSGTAYNPAGKHIIGESAIRLGVNMIAYVLGSTEYGRFLAQQFPVYGDKTRAGDLFRYAMVRYSGSWDVNPGIQNSLLLGLFDNTKINVDLMPNVVTLDDPQTANYPLLFMTGHYDFEFTPREVEGLSRFLQKGGMLVASAAAGLKPFDIAFRREMKKAFPKNDLIKLPPTHPIFGGGWNPIEKITYTASALKDNPSLEYPEFYGLFVDNRLAVLYSPFDLNSGLNRESNAYAKGIVSDDALRVAINIVTYALSH